jgi:RimJ/RimL family protein N-acetyltransferase
MLDLKIETPRLQLIPATSDLLMADLAGLKPLCAALGVRDSGDWPPQDSEYDEGALRFFLKMLAEQGEANACWYSWYVVLLSGTATASTLAGNGGFFGPPDKNGSVEIGYSICQEWRRQRIGTETVKALVAFAWNYIPNRVMRIQARTNPANFPSIRVLLANGFQEVAREDPEKLKFELLRDRSI